MKRRQRPEQLDLFEKPRESKRVRVSNESLERTTRNFERQGWFIESVQVLAGHSSYELRMIR